MIQLRLTDRELVYLAAQSGALRFYGISDPFFGMSPGDLRIAVEEIKRSLHKKNYAAVGFEQNFSIRSEVLEVIGICSKCERYLSVALTNSGSDHFRYIVYKAESRLALLEETDPGAFQLKGITADDVQELRSGIGCSPALSADNSGASVPVSVPFQTLARAQKAAVGGQDPTSARRILMEAGCSYEIAETLVAAYQAKTPSLSVNFIALKERRSDGFLAFWSESGFVRLSPIWLDEEESWQISLVPSSDLHREFQYLVRRCAAGEREVDEA